MRLHFSTRLSPFLQRQSTHQCRMHNQIHDGHLLLENAMSHCTPVKWLAEGKENEHYVPWCYQFNTRWPRLIGHLSEAFFLLCGILILINLNTFQRVEWTTTNIGLDIRSVPNSWRTIMSTNDCLLSRFIFVSLDLDVLTQVFLKVSSAHTWLHDRLRCWLFCVTCITTQQCQIVHNSSSSSCIVSWWLYIWYDWWWGADKNFCLG